MQIFQNLWRVIFMLSTIVYVTDCCSSRILLLKEHTMKLVRHAQPQQHHQNQHHHQIYEHDSSSLQLQQKLPQHVDIVTHTVREYNKNFSSEMHSQQERKEKAEDDDNSTTTENIEMVTTTENTENYDENHTVDMVMESTTDTVLVSKDNEITVTDNENTTAVSNVPSTSDTTMRERHAGNSKYHLTDFYYTIMRDVLSFECYGQFLTDFCLNRGRCFLFPIGNNSFFSCECADGYIGERCESKHVDGLYVAPSSVLLKESQQPKIRLARLVISFPMLIVFSVIYLIIAALVVFRKPKNRATGMLES